MSIGGVGGRPAFTSDNGLPANGPVPERSSLRNQVMGGVIEHALGLIEREMQRTTDPHVLRQLQATKHALLERARVQGLPMTSGRGPSAAGAGDDAGVWPSERTLNASPKFPVRSAGLAGTPSLQVFNGPSGQPRRRENIDGYLMRLAYLETRLRCVPNMQGSGAQGFFQTMGPFHREASRASGGANSRSRDYDEAARAVEAWIRVHRPRAYEAIAKGRFDEADTMLRQTWPSLPGGSQAQHRGVQVAANRYLPNAERQFAAPWPNNGFWPEGVTPAGYFPP